MSKDNVEQDVAFIRALADLIRESDLNEIEVKREYGDADELKIRLSRGIPLPLHAPVPAPAPAPAAGAPAPAPAAAPVPDGQAEREAPAEDPSSVLTSPMVGTVYLAPEPGADPFVSVGTQVSEGDTVLIIEAMKTMNQIAAPRGGTVKRIMVENAEPVEFGAPLLVIE